MNAYLDIPSPSGSSFQYVYGDHDSYFDPSTSESQSEINSPYDMGNYYPDGSDAPPEYLPISPRETTEIASPEAAEQASSTKVPAKRKRENRYKNASPSVLSRRRAQNRASQRAYRERKDQRIKDLESELSRVQQNAELLRVRNMQLENQLNNVRVSQYAALTAVTPAVALGSAGAASGPTSTGQVTPADNYGGFEVGSAQGMQDSAGVGAMFGGYLGSMYGQI